MSTAGDRVPREVAMVRIATFGIAALALLATVGCGASGGDRRAAPRASASSPAAASVNIVAIGDSDTTGAGDPTGHGWVGSYGDLVGRTVKTPVSVTNLAVEGKTSEELRTEVTGDASLRKVLSDADVILIGIGGADLNAGDDALGSGRCQGRACYVPVLRAFDTNIRSIAAEVQRVAPAAAVRSMSLPNAFPGAGGVIPPFATADLSRYQVEAERASVCAAMRSSGGQCVDVVRAFNGSDSNADAYATGLMTKDPCCYPSAKGQQLIARLLLATGGVKAAQ
jgi:lysophospholipase L1-like esterase